MSSQRSGKVPSALTPARRISLGEDVAERLRNAILHGELGPGQHLREEELAERLEVSRGPVRDAFVLLERQGLVRVSRHRGVSVVELTRNDLHEIYTLRSALEPLAITLAIQRATADDMAAMDRRFTQMSSGFSRRVTAREAAWLDVEFHDTIYQAAHHQRLSSAWDQIRLPAYWFMLTRNVASPDWRERTVKGHADILRVIRTGDETAAAELIKEHIYFAYERILQTYLASVNETPEMAEPAEAEAPVRLNNPRMPR